MAMTSLGSATTQICPWSRCGSLQMLHTGSYGGEPASFALMADFAAANGLERAGERHREIYLNNAQRTEPDKLKTILRFSVR